MKAKRERKNPKIRKNKVYFRIFGTAITIVLLAVFISGCTKEVLKDQSGSDPLLTATIAETFPVNQADTVVINPVVAVTFKSTASASEVSSTTLTLKEGTIPVAGTVTKSGTTINFTPSTDLKPETNYTATIKSPKSSGNESGEHSWSFKTGKNRQNNSLSVVSVTPLKNATEVAVDTKPTVTFNQEMTSSMTKLVTITLLQGTTPVTGTLTYSGKTATFIPTNSLAANTVYNGKVVFGTKSDSDDEDDNDDDDDNMSASAFTWNFTTVGGGADVTPPTVLSVVPANNTTAVALNSKATVTFSEGMNASTINATNFSLKQGTTTVAGTAAYSGTTATFTPSSALAANTVYTGTISTGAKDAAGNALASNYSWSFTTAAAADVTPPTVLSVIPANNATTIATSIHPSVTFSEAMNASTINATNFSLKQGTTTVAGTVAYSGATATFTPAASLLANTVYTGTITTGAKDAAGNALASNFIWSFTTATAIVTDVTPPTVLTIVPASGATSIAVNSNVTATFNEAMNSSTINATTFTLKQGSTTVAGSVTYSGTTATFNPTNDLSGGTIYTASITTGAKDAVGNAIATTKTWSFTTIAAAPVVSWATQVWPIIQSKCTPCHGSSGGSGGVNMGSYAQVAAMSNSQIDNSGMYTKLGVTAAEQTIIKAWIAAGKLNN